MSVGSKPKSVSVKTLVEFAAKSGSLDHKFTSSPTGQEGIEVNKRLTKKREKDYQT
jgi:DNA excision repair protein ERCC-2